MQKTPALSPARAVSTAAMADLFEASMAPATRRAYQGALTRLSELRTEIDLTALLNMLHCVIWSVSPKVCRADAR